MGERRRLSVAFLEQEELTEDVVRELWELRLDHLTLHKSREDDWAYFRGFLARDDASAFVFRDPHGTVQGFFTIAMLPVEAHGRRGLLLYSKYFYFHRAYRGHPSSTLAPWLLLPKALRRHGLRWLHFCTSAFPQSFVSLARGSGNLHALGEPGISPWQQEALTRFAHEFYPDDFDEAAGLVRNQNVADEEGLPRGQEAQALYERYERRNPTWREGNSLPVVFRVDLTLVVTNLRRNLRRLRRNLG